MPEKSLAIFEGQKVRRIWNETEEKWYFSIVDIVQVLTQQSNYQTARKYWNKLKERLNKEGNESVTNCHQLKFMANDGKFYATDAAEVETLLRLIQSIPSPKAEPIKLWQNKGLEENKIPAKKGGKIAKHARLELEKKTGKSTITDENFLPPAKKLKRP